MKVSRAGLVLEWVFVLVVERGGCERGSLAGRDAGEPGRMRRNVRVGRARSSPGGAPFTERGLSALGFVQGVVDPERSAGSGTDACRAACPTEGLFSRVPLAAATPGLAGPRARQSATCWR